MIQPTCYHYQLELKNTSPKTLQTQYVYLLLHLHKENSEVLIKQVII